MEKKMLSLVLALLMMTALLAGCGGKDGQTDGQKDGQPGQTVPEITGKSEREHITVRFAQFSNSLDDVEGYANDPIKKEIEEAVGITLEYDTGTEGFDDRMETELYTGVAADLFPTWGEAEKIASFVENELVVNIGEIINAEPERYPVLHKIINSTEYRMYNKLYTGDEDAAYAIYGIYVTADPLFGGVPVYNQSILDQISEGKVPRTVDEFIDFSSAAGEAGYVGWWPLNDKLTYWYEINCTLAVPQGTSIMAPTACSGTVTGAVLSGELGTDSEYWTISTTSEASQNVVRQLAELYKSGGLDARIGIKGDYDDAYADFGLGKTGAFGINFGYPAMISKFYETVWLPVNPDANASDLVVGSSLASDSGYGSIYVSSAAVNSHYFIPYSCKNPDRVLDLVEFIASNKGQDLLFNCIDGEYNFEHDSDYWRAIDSAYGYTDGRCRYMWFSYLFSGAEFYTDLESQDWWTAVTHPVDFSDNWSAAENTALKNTVRQTVSEYTDDLLVSLPFYYNMIAMPSSSRETVNMLSSITNEYLSKFIVGQLDVDTDWHTYVEAYENMGAADLEKTINEAVATARTNYSG